MYRWGSNGTALASPWNAAQSTCSGLQSGGTWRSQPPYGRVAEVVRLDQRDRAQRLGRGQLAHLLNAVPAIHLHADLDHASRAAEGVSHAPGVARVEGHRLFLVHVLARLDGGDEVNRVQVLRRRDQDRVDRLVVEQRPVVLERRDAGNDRLDFIEAAGVDVGDRGRLDVRALDRGLQDLLAARTAADQAEPDSLVRPSDSAAVAVVRRRQPSQPRCSSDHRPQEYASIGHGSPHGRKVNGTDGTRSHGSIPDGA